MLENGTLGFPKNNATHGNMGGFFFAQKNDCPEQPIFYKNLVGNQQPFFFELLNENDSHSHLAHPDVNENHSHLAAAPTRQSAELKFLICGALRQSAKTKCQSEVYARQRPL